jgi:hypothetical protein
VSAELADRIEVDLASIRLVLADHRPLIDASAVREPEIWERTALGAVLHAFYNGVENCLRHIVLEQDGRLPDGSDSHAAILTRAMTRAGPHEPLIGARLGENLKEYLRFRHFFRHSYSFSLDWRKMAQLVKRLASTADEFEAAMRVVTSRLRTG